MAKKTPAKPAPDASLKESEGSEKTVASVTVSVEVDVPAEKLFDFIAEPQNLPRWAGPIKSVRRTDGKQLVDYQMPEGTALCECDAALDKARGTADWVVHVPGSDDIKVYTRAVGLAGARSAFILTLVSPPMPKHAVKNGLAVVQKNLAKDLDKVRAILGGAA